MYNEQISISLSDSRLVGRWGVGSEGPQITGYTYHRLRNLLHISKITEKCKMCSICSNPPPLRKIQGAHQ